MADWEDDEDAFLYGGGASVPAASTSSALKQEGGTPQPTVQNANPVLSVNENSVASRTDDSAGEADMDEEDEEDEEEEDSEDDFQIIMDTNPTSAPPSHHELARRTGAVPVRPAAPSLVKEASSRPDSAQPGRYDSTSPSKPSIAPAAVTNPFLNLNSTSHSTGTPIPTPARSPAPNINDTSATYSVSRGDDGPDSKPAPQPILDIDLDSIDDPKWRKGGAHLADYFNYGFDEPTWKEWTSKQHRMRKERDKERDNPFHVFADRPLAEAWASLPMELKGLMMQTIMSSFNGASGPQQQQQQQMMQGMMGPGMGGMSGMQGMPGMGMGNMGGMGMQGGSGMNMMGGGHQQHRGGMGSGQQGNMMGMPSQGMGYGGGNLNMRDHMAGGPSLAANRSGRHSPDYSPYEGGSQASSNPPNGHRQGQAYVNPLKRPPPPNASSIMSPDSDRAPKMAKANSNQSPQVSHQDKQGTGSPSAGAVPTGPRNAITTSKRP